MKAFLYLNPADIPGNYRLVTEEAAQHPDTGAHGALIRNTLTGVYVIYAAGVTSSCPQDWAANVDKHMPINNIASLRASKGLTQQQLADSAGINIRQVQKFESGERTLLGASVDVVGKIARALGVTIEALVCEKTHG